MKKYYLELCFVFHWGLMLPVMFGRALKSTWFLRAIQMKASRFYQLKGLRILRIAMNQQHTQYLLLMTQKRR
ncbi:hypothetical protein L1D15_11205 [Vibrio sp. Isolate25]|nr:hypothetical protein [Vibrio sp. Isolate25]